MAFNSKVKIYTHVVWVDSYWVLTYQLTVLSFKEGATAMCSDEAIYCEAPSERNQRERGKSSSKEDTTSLVSSISLMYCLL